MIVAAGIWRLKTTRLRFPCIDRFFSPAGPTARAAPD
jgi:hypothetical protein